MAKIKHTKSAPKKDATPTLNRQAKHIVASMVKDPGLRQAVLDGLKASEIEYLNTLGIKPGSYLKGQRLTAGEALYGFVGWLTTRDRPIILSGHHNASAPFMLVNQFMDHHKMAAPREGWEHGLHSMKDVATEITNDPSLNPNQVAPPPPTFDEAFTIVLNTFQHFHLQRQNHLLARLVEELKETREAEENVVSRKANDYSERRLQLAEAGSELAQILAGSFTIVHV